MLCSFIGETVYRNKDLALLILGYLLIHDTDAMYLNLCNKTKHKHMLNDHDMKDSPCLSS